MARHAIAKRWSSARMSMIDIDPVKEYAKAVLDNVEEGLGLILAGPPGVGKSFALAALTHHFMRKAAGAPDRFPRLDYVYITAPEFFDLIPVVGDSIDEFRGQSYLKTFGHVPLLVVNDLGKEYRGGKLDEQVPMKLGRILRTRSEEKLPTFISTNLAPEAIRANYGNAITSLLQENCTTYIVGGQDRRKLPALRAIPGGRKTA